VFVGVGERTREGSDLYNEMSRGGSHPAGQPGASKIAPGVRPDERTAGAPACAWPCLASPSPNTSAMKKNQDVLLFIDNIFPVFAGRLRGIGVAGPHRQRRRLSTNTRRRNGRPPGNASRPTKKGSITSFQAVYVPADDLTDPCTGHNVRALGPRLSYWSVRLPNWGSILRWTLWPSTSRALTPEIVGQEHYDVARGVQKVLQRFKDLQDIIAILGMDELSPEDKMTVFACAQDSALF